VFVNFNILNQLGSPAINSNTFANRPAAGQTGRLFVSTDTFEIYRDNGTTWDLIGGPGTSTITGTGTATQVAYFTSSQAIGSDSNLFWDNANIRLGIGTSSPGARLDIHGSGVVGQFNGTTSASNIYLAFQRGGVNLWRVGDMYNSGQNFFEIRNSVLSNNAVEILATSNEATFLSTKTYSTGNAIGVAVQHNLTIPNGVNVGLAALGGVNSNLNLTLQGSTTVANTGRQGLEGSTSISFTGAGTLTMTQGSTVRAFSALSSVYAFNGSAVGTITHLAGLRICFPDNVGSAVNITNNYALLINNQTTGLGTVTYTNRWGIYQEGASDLNYFAANLLLGSTVNNGNALQVTGSSYFSSNIAIGTTTPTVISNYNAITINGTAGSFTEYRENNAFAFRIGSDSSLGGFIAQTTASPIRIFTNSIERMRVTSAGYVGIGTSTPSVGLQVEDAGNTYAVNISANNQTNGIAIGTLSTNVAVIQGYSRTFSTLNSIVLQPSGSNVLIGTTTDAGQKLQVNGTAKCDGDFTISTSSETSLFLANSSANSFRAISKNNGKYVIQHTGILDLTLLDTSGNLEIVGSMKTAAPAGGTQGAWKLGSRVAAAVALDATQYIELEVGGTLYKLAIVT